MTISYSRGTSITDSRPEQRTAANFATFADAILEDRASAKGQQYICAAMADGHRCKASAQPRRWIGLDLDGSTPEAFAHLREAMAGHSGLVYTTSSHTPTAPRARVVLELAFAADRASAAATSKRLRESFGPGLAWDTSCDKAEQPLFLPLHGAEAWRFTGRPIIPVPAIAAVPAAPAAPIAPAHPLACVVAANDLERACDDLRAADEGGRNNLLAAISHRIGSYVGAARLLRDEATRALLDAVAAWGESEKEKSRATIDYQLTKGAREPLVLVVPAMSVSVAPAVVARGGRISNLADLMDATFNPPMWAIHGILPGGATIIAGPPKSGKSFLVLQWGIAIATGTAIWNDRAPEVQGGVLYIALEDKEQRMQHRVRKYIDDQHIYKTRLHDFDYMLEWPRGADGVAKIRTYLDAHPECRMVIIDTLGAFRDTDPGRKSAYAHDYETGALFKGICREFDVAVVLVMHTRKQAAADHMDTVNGTQGITGSVDNVLTLQKPKRAADENYAVLNVDGRDIENPTELALTRNEHTGFWACRGNVADVSRTNESQAVLAALKTIGGIGSARQIHDAIGSELKFGTLKVRLSRMAQRGEIMKSGNGDYSLPPVGSADLPVPQPITIKIPGAG